MFMYMFMYVYIDTYTHHTHIYMYVYHMCPYMYTYNQFYAPILFTGVPVPVHYIVGAEMLLNTAESQWSNSNSRPKSMDQEQVT